MTLPIDDETQRYRIETPDCQMDIAVREQVRREGAWVSLLVPRQQRPSLPVEERRELQRQFIENLRTPKEQAFPFEDRPQTCFDAVGDFQIERSGIRFAFLTPLPGDLNRFVIERTDLDANRGRLYFTRGECV